MSTWYSTFEFTLLMNPQVFESFPDLQLAKIHSDLSLNLVTSTVLLSFSITSASIPRKLIFCRKSYPNEMGFYA